MTTYSARRIDTLGNAGNALREALQWRVLVIWVSALLVPTLMLQLPLWRLLASTLDTSPRARAFAQHFDALAAEDVMTMLSRSGQALTGAALLAIALAVVLNAFLAGVTVTALRRAPYDRALGFVGLLQGGVAWYRRMFRMTLVSLVPLAAAAGLAHMLRGLASTRAEHVRLESEAKLGHHAALAGIVLVFAFIHLTIEAGRAELAADDHLRSAWRAWARGLVRLVDRPVAMLVAYAGPMLVGMVLATLVLLVRVRLTPSTPAMFVLAWLVTQLGVAIIGWARISRLFALSAIAREAGPSAAVAEIAPPESVDAST